MLVFTFKESIKACQSPLGTVIITFYKALMWLLEMGISTVMPSFHRQAIPLFHPTLSTTNLLLNPKLNFNLSNFSFYILVSITKTRLKDLSLTNSLRIQIIWWLPSPLKFQLKILITLIFDLMLDI